MVLNEVIDKLIELNIDPETAVDICEDIVRLCIQEIESTRFKAVYTTWDEQIIQHAIDQLRALIK